VPAIRRALRGRRLPPIPPATHLLLLDDPACRHRRWHASAWSRRRVTDPHRRRNGAVDPARCGARPGPRRTRQRNTSAGGPPCPEIRPRRHAARLTTLSLRYDRDSTANDIPAAVPADRCAGETAVSIGPSLVQDLHLGYHVCAREAPFRRWARAHGDHVKPVQDHVSVSVAAFLPETRSRLSPSSAHVELGPNSFTSTGPGGVGHRMRTAEPVRTQGDA